MGFHTAERPATLKRLCNDKAKVCTEPGLFCKAVLGDSTLP